MKIFLCWGGSLSHIIAGALNNWLPLIIQSLKPIYSPEFDKGTRWSNELDDALEGTKFGIVCLTPDNLKNTWIHYETGALSKTKDAAVWTFLYNVKHEDITPPLSKFQHTLAERDDILQLLKTINRHLKDVDEDPRPEALLEETFNIFWPKLETQFKEANESIGKETITPRDERTILTEILEVVRNQEQRFTIFKETQKKIDQLLDSYPFNSIMPGSPPSPSGTILPPGTFLTYTATPSILTSTETHPTLIHRKTRDLTLENEKTDREKNKKDKSKK